MATATEKKVGYQIKSGRTFRDRAAAGRALVWGKGVISEEDIKKIKNPAELLLKYREELERIEKVSGIGINHLASMIKHDLADIKYRQVDPKSGLLLSVIESQKIREAAKKATTASKVTKKKTEKKGKEKSAEKNSKGAQKAPKSEENHNQEAEVKAIAAEISADLDVKPSKAEEAVRKVMKRRK